MSVLDLERGQEIRRVPVPGQPAGIAASGKLGAAFVVSPGSKNVRRLDIYDGSLVAEAQLEGGPMGIALDTARRRVFVSDWFNARIWVLSPENLRQMQVLTTGGAPAGLGVSPDGQWLASANRDANSVLIFDAAFPRSYSYGHSRRPAFRPRICPGWAAVHR